MKRRGSAGNSLCTMSARVGASAVAVTAMSCISRFAGDGSRDLGEIGVFGAEIMAPLRDAMGLVDGQNIGAGRAQERLRIGAHQPFGRDIEEAIAPLPQALLDRGVVARRC